MEKSTQHLYSLHCSFYWDLLLEDLNVNVNCQLRADPKFCWLLLWPLCSSSNHSIQFAAMGGHYSPQPQHQQACVPTLRTPGSICLHTLDPASVHTKYSSYSLEYISFWQESVNIEYYTFNSHAEYITIQIILHCLYQLPDTGDSDGSLDIKEAESQGLAHSSKLPSKIIHIKSERQSILK